MTTPIAENALMRLLDGGATLITANSRLPIDLRRRHGAWHGAQCVWTTPAILPLTRWLEEAVDEAILAGRLPVDAASLRILSAFEERVLWERAIGEVEHGALMDLQSLATAAQDANTLTRIWDIRFDPLLSTEESRHFERWRQAFEATCQRHGVLDASRATAQHLAWLAEGRLAAPHKAILAGYTELGPLEKAFCAAVETAGGQVFQLMDDSRAERLRVQPCRDARAEVLAAAAWAAKLLEANAPALSPTGPHPQPTEGREERSESLRDGNRPALRLSIVVPDLAKLRMPLIRALDAELQPESAWNADSPRRLLNFSLGVPLSAYPLVATALDLLAVLASPGKVELALLCRLLRSPHWSNWVGDQDARGRLEWHLRREGSAWTGLEHAAFRAGATGASACAAHLEQLAALKKEAGRRRDGREWAALLPAWLESLGWPGSRSLDSDEHQTLATFSTQMEGLAGLDGLHPAGRLSTWRSLLARQCRERVFQPQTRHRAWVEVLGLLEAVGQRFDGLWVMGLTDMVLPAAPRPNPLIPPTVQRELDLPHASPEREQAFARALLQSLVSAAPEVVLSHPAFEGDSELRPSPLLAALGVPAALFEPAPANLPPPAPLESLRDDFGPPLAPEPPLRGGSQVLAVQAQCPLAAFVRFRLGAEALKVPSPGPDASQRGTLLHLALAALWRDLGSQAKLLTLNEAGARAAIEAAVASALASFEEQNPGLMGERLAALESARLSRLILHWLDFEEARPPFAVVAVEQERVVALQGLGLKLTLDRLDRLEDGSLVVLDYKTGKPQLGEWVGPRLLSPQLPLYAREVAAEAAGNSIAGVGFARLKVGESEFLSTTRSADLLPGAHVPGEQAGRRRNPFLDFPDFDALLATWSSQLDGLAGEIQSGYGANQAWVDDSRLRWLDAWPVLRRTGLKDEETEEVAE